MAFRTCLSCWPNPCISEIQPSDFQTSHLEKLGPSARFFRFPLWEPVVGHLTPRKDIADAKFASPLESEQDLLNWCSEKVHFLDQSCEETKFERSVSMYDELCREDKLAEVLICRHREGSFNLSPEIVSQCLDVAKVISLSCFLFCLRLAPFVYDDGSVFDMSDLTNELSSLSDKWEWSGDACQNAFTQWNQGFISECEDSEMQEALKLLYQMTCIPLESVFFCVDREMNRASIGGDQYAGARRVIKCGDELCNFLEDYRTLFQLCGDIEFVYVDIFDYHSRTAGNHLVLGNHERATELLTTVKSVLDQIEGNLQEGGQLVARREVHGCKIAYLPSDVLTISPQIWTISSLLNKSTGDSNLYADDMNKSLTQFAKEISDRKLESEAYAAEQNLTTTRFDRETDDIMRLIGEERDSEAKEIFNQLDLKEGMLNSNLHHFLEVVNERLGKYSLSSDSALKWESFCKMKELLLDFSLASGDRLLTAKFSEQYGIALSEHSNSQVNKLFKRGIHNVQEASTSQLGSNDVSQGPGDSEAQDAASIRKLWLKEVLNLEFTTPAPELLKEVVSWLSDPCTLDEHKRVNLPEMVKACRLLKHSIDIYSDLLHDWAEGSSNEAEWLQLLESQKTVHVTVQSHLLHFASLCLQTLQDSNDLSVKVFSQNKTEAIDGSGTISSVVIAFLISVLVWVERGRSRTLLYQLGPWYTMKHGDAEKLGSLKEELIEFDKNEQAALSSILSCQLACTGEPLFIEYSTQNLTGRRAVAFMIHKDPSVHARIIHCQCDEVEDLVKKFYSAIPRQRKDASVVVEVHSVLERLYDLLIRDLSEEAIFKHLNPKATIVFVPDKILYRVPFALLRDRTTQKYLFQLHPIAIAPSLRVLQHCEQRLRTLDKFPLKPEGCILAVGNPSYETNLLPGTGEELEHLRSCFPNQVKTLEKDEATRGNFLELVEEAGHSKEEYVFALIHLGVHGHWSKTSQVHKTGSLQFAKVPQHSGSSSSNDTRPGPSCTNRGLEQGFGSDAVVSHDVERYGSTSGELGVVRRSAGYSSSAADDMLPSEDIVKSGFQWRTRLVVLSACNSSRGQDYSDGEVNLPRALMVAGVPAAVVSQWEIGDSSSPVLMKAFYENLKSGKDVASALQSAMIQLSSDQLESENDIFGWGPFLVWGLPTVHLPEELWTENARKALAAKQQAESLGCLLDHVADANVRKALFNEVLKVHTFLDEYSATNAHCALRQEVINGIFAIEELLRVLIRSDPRVSLVVIALAEEVYMLVPFKHLETIELGLEEHSANAKFIIGFRQHIMYTQATKGRHQRALDYAEKLIKTSQDAKDHFIFRQERAVIWRLMGKHEDAHKEFNDLLLASGETYELLIQISYLKHLMKDKHGALEYAQRAKKFLERDLGLSTTFGYGTLILGFKSLPNDYRQWLSNVDESTRTN